MSTLEARIAEVIAGHWSASTHTDREPFVDKCDGCGAVVRTWGESHGTWRDSPLVTHQAAMLAPVIREAQAEALRDAADLLAPKGILWWGDSGVRVSDGPFGMPQGSLDDWLRARADNLEAPNAS